MDRPWLAEREVPPGLAAALIAGQFPDLAPVRIEPFGTGWDNVAYLVNGDLIFRFPRRQIAAPLMATETRLLPFLAPRLPLAVPVPLYAGRPGDGYPWPFAGYRRLPGRTACVAALDEAQRRRSARRLAEFMAALHATPLADAEVAGAGPDPMDRLNVPTRVAQVRERLDRIARLGLVPDTRPWDPLVDSPPPAPAGEATVLAHGDLYARHFLVDDSGRLTGILDWGDVHLGHPAVDLHVVWSFLPPAARDEFFAVYGRVDAATARLARFRALNHALGVTVYAHDIADADLLREGLLALRYLAVE